MQVLNNIKLKPYGFSHSSIIGIEIKGIGRGYKIDFELIDSLLVKRKGSGKYNTTRSESEKLEIKSGFTNEITDGKPIIIEIKQTNFKKSDYQFGTVRPGHADLSAYQKYGSDWNYSGGGQFSGRLTILYVIAGEIARQVLVKTTKLEVIGHVSQVAQINDTVNSMMELKAVQNQTFPMVNPRAKASALEFLAKLKAKGDSCGGKLDVYITDLDRNYGDDFFGSLESKISFLLFSVPAVKAIEFGYGTKFANSLGSEVVEQLFVENARVVSKTNYNGGINGGIANLAAPLKLSVTIKPTSTIFQQVETVKYDGHSFSESTINMRGRHDAFIANRALWPIIGLLNILFLDMEMEDVKSIQKSN